MRAGGGRKGMECVKKWEEVGREKGTPSHEIREGEGDGQVK